MPMETPTPNPETGADAILVASRTSPALRILFCLVAVLSVAWLFLTWQLVSASARQRVVRGAKASLSRALRSA